MSLTTSHSLTISLSHDIFIKNNKIEYLVAVEFVDYSVETSVEVVEHIDDLKLNVISIAQLGAVSIREYLQGSTLAGERSESDDIREVDGDGIEEHRIYVVAVLQLLSYCSENEIEFEPASIREKESDSCK